MVCLHLGGTYGKDGIRESGGDQTHIGTAKIINHAILTKTDTGQEVFLFEFIDSLGFN